MIGTINIGAIVHNTLNCISPVEPITMWNAQPDNTVDDNGYPITVYSKTDYQARCYSASNEIIYKNNLEFGKEYKVFYVLTNNVHIVNRPSGDSGDYIYYSDNFWRIINIQENFNTSWTSFLAILTDEVLHDTTSD